MGKSTVMMRNEGAKDRNLVTDAIPNYAGRDCCFLALVTILSSAFFVSRIGFYWDDWQLLKILHFSDDQSLIGLVRSLFGGWPELMARPVQALHFAILYKPFGLRPLGYHLANTATFFLGLCAFYIALRSLTERRLMSLATTVIYGLLPHYSTDRFWYATFNANVSMVFYFLSLYCDVSLLTFRRSWHLVMESHCLSQPVHKCARIRSFHTVLSVEPCADCPQAAAA